MVHGSGNRYSQIGRRKSFGCQVIFVIISNVNKRNIWLLKLKRWISGAHQPEGSWDWGVLEENWAENLDYTMRWRDFWESTYSATYGWPLGWNNPAQETPRPPSYMRELVEDWDEDIRRWDEDQNLALIQQQIRDFEESPLINKFQIYNWSSVLTLE